MVGLQGQISTFFSFSISLNIPNNKIFFFLILRHIFVKKKKKSKQGCDLSLCLLFIADSCKTKSYPIVTTKYCQIGKKPMDSIHNRNYFLSPLRRHNHPQRVNASIITMLYDDAFNMKISEIFQKLFIDEEKFSNNF